MSTSKTLYQAQVAQVTNVTPSKIHALFKFMKSYNEQILKKCHVAILFLRQNYAYRYIYFD